MAPWWSRPIADGADDDDEAREGSRPTGEARLSDLAVEEVEMVDESEETEESPSRSRSGRTRKGRSGRGGAAKVADEATPTEAAEPSRRGRAKTGDAKADAKAAESGPAEAKKAEPKRQEPKKAEAKKPEAPKAEPSRRDREDEAGGRRERSESRKDRDETRKEPGNGSRAATGGREELRPGDTVSVPLSRLEDLSREIVITMPERASSWEEERKLALFCDLENVALGVRDSGVKFDINLVLERLVEKGKIIVKRAYCDWNRYADYKRAFHEAGIELIDIPQKHYSGKNSADIKMVVDAMDLSYSKEHLDTFVLLSGDSDFSPLVSKLKENNKYVIGVGVKGSSSNLLIDNCDEFIYYEDIWRDLERSPKLESLSKKEKEVFGLLVESIQALVRENKDVLWGSMIKQTMQRKRPSFNEGYHGYSTFSELLEDAEKKGVVKLKKDQRSGSYIVTGFARRK